MLSLGFFEDHLSAVGRGLDGCFAWMGERARAAGDRGRHARSFDAIRDRMDRAKDAAIGGAERSLDTARERWWRRDPVDRDRVKGLTVWVGVLLAVIVGAALLRGWVAPEAPKLSDAEIAAIRGVRQQQGLPSQGVSPGLEGWFGRSGP